MHDTGCSGLMHWADPEGWDGEEGGRGVWDGKHMYIHDGFKSKYGKTNTMLLSKINKLILRSSLKKGQAFLKLVLKKVTINKYF